MVNIKIKNGSILEIPLDNELGFCYAKYIDLSSKINRNFGSQLLKVYAIASINPIKDIEYIVNNDLLFAPILLSGKPTTRGQKAWKVIGNKLAESDNEIPIFKSARCFPYIVEDESKIGPWQYVELGKDETLIEYGKICHLEQNTLHNEEQVVARIVMELLRSEGRDVYEYFGFDGNESSLYGVYLKMKNVPIYKSIPEIIRGKINFDDVKIDDYPH
jgi:hypothetical protein